jgi:toxin ParE1/3/4
LTDAQDW